MLLYCIQKWNGTLSLKNVIDRIKWLYKNSVLQEPGFGVVWRGEEMDFGPCRIIEAPVKAPLRILAATV